VDTRSWRERFGNLKEFKAGGSYTKEEWRAEKLKQAKRNRFSKSGAGRKRKLDEDGNLAPDEPVYYRTIKFRVRFSDPNRQRKILNGWCGAARYTYNRALRGVNEEGMPLTLQSLRDRYVVAGSVSSRARLPETEEGWAAKAKRDAKKAAAKASVGYETGELVAEKPWLRFTPEPIRSGAISALINAQSALQAKAALARERGDASVQNQEWEFEGKSKTEPADSTLTIEHRKIRELTVVDRPSNHGERKSKRAGVYGPCPRRRTWTEFMMFGSSIGKSFKCSDGQPLGKLYLTQDLSNPKFGGDGVSPITIEHDCKLTRDSRGRFFLHVPIETPLPDTKPLPEREMGSIDPGSRTPFTAWGPTGHGSFGDDGFKKTILPLCEQLDVLVGRRDRAKTKWQTGQWTNGAPNHGLAFVGGDFAMISTSGQWLGGLKSYTRVLSRLERRIAVLRDRIKNLVDDLHKRVARSLLEKFDTVLVPVFETQKMVEHINEETGRRRIVNSKVARSLMTWAHYRFRSFLKHKALLLGKEVIIVTEEYTTKGCSRCGLITDIGGSKTFTCQHCGLVAPRDAKSARDIFAKHIVSPA
jgi:IS605 OrfB family transposase